MGPPWATHPQVSSKASVCATVLVPSVQKPVEALHVRELLALRGQAGIDESGPPSPGTPWIFVGRVDRSVPTGRLPRRTC